MITAFTLFAGAICFFAGFLAGYGFLPNESKKENPCSFQQTGEICSNEFESFLKYDGTDRSVNV